MPHQCHGHSHGGVQEEKADIFTNANSIIAGATSFLSMLFFVARLVDTFGDYEKQFAGMSYPAMPASIIIALCASIGSTVCHRALNKQNQEGNKDPICEPHHHEGAHVAINTQPKQTDERLENSQKPLLQAPTVGTIQLTHLQRLMLLADFIGHASDIASPILFIMLYAFEMQKYQKAILYAGSFAIGLFGSVASVKPCRNALLKKNVNTDHDTLHDEEHGHSHQCHGHSHSNG